MIQLDVFNDDEKQYLNALTKGRFREKISQGMWRTIRTP